MISRSELRRLLEWTCVLFKSGVLTCATQREVLRALRDLVDAPDELNAKLESGELKMREFMQTYNGVDDPREMLLSELSTWPWLFAALDITHAFTHAGADEETKRGLAERADPDAYERMELLTELADWETDCVATPGKLDALLKQLAGHYTP